MAEDETPKARTTRVSRLLVVSALGFALTGTAVASAPPVGPLPKPRVTTVKAHVGSLIPVAAPVRKGYVWRIARAFNSRVVGEIAEADVGPTVVLVFKAVGRGHTSIVLAQTQRETPKAYRAVRYDLTVS